MADDVGYLTGRSVRALLETHGLEPHKTLGQNFLVDPNTVRRIVRLSRVQDGDRVIEIGPGLGSLSVGLLAAGADLRVVELDERLLPALRQVLGDDADVIVGDARRIDWDEVAPGGPWTVVANLPYNVAAGVVLSILESAPQIIRLVVMVQREVAERLVAEPGSRIYGIPSVKVRFRARGRVLASVGRDVFVPTPRVDSAIVELVRLDPPRPEDSARVFALVDRAFGQRRKMLSTSLRGLLTPEDFGAAAVDPRDRPESLDVDAWCRLAQVAR